MLFVVSNFKGHAPCMRSIHQGDHRMSAKAQTTTPAAPPSLPEPGTPAVAVENFSKTYGSNRVVDHLDFTIQRGEVFALLGPNGAGKTTTVETIEGYRVPD